MRVLTGREDDNQATPMKSNLPHYEALFCLTFLVLSRGQIDFLMTREDTRMNGKLKGLEKAV